MKIKLDGVKSLITALNRVEKKVGNQANKLVAGAALRTVAMAKSRLQPRPEDSRELAMDIGAVRQSINFTHNSSTLSAKVFAGNVTGEHLAAYLEFGTGRHAAGYVPNLPDPFPRLAMTFYVNGRGQMKQHPYLIPSYLQEGKRLSEKLKGLKISW
ncbi:hypothetical protein [Pedobacter sp.]|uniref:hypothetical protein n=1 Tax=Pedobacter sp. TaxID=1411316 RepID=UPI003C3F7076